MATRSKQQFLHSEFGSEIFVSQLCDALLGKCVALELYCIANCDAIPAIADPAHMIVMLLKKVETRDILVQEVGQILSRAESP